MFTQTETGGMRERGITRRQVMKGATFGGMTVAAGSTMGGLLSPANDYATSSVPLSDKVTALAPAVTRCFALRCNEGYLLIDVPYPGNYELLCECLKEAGIDISEIRYLLLTHHHDDHVDCVNELVRETGATIIAHEKAVTHLAAGRSDPDDRPINNCIGVLVGIYSLFHEFVFPPVMLRESDLLITGDDDALLPRLGIHGKIIHTPGHTHDSISVILSDGSAIVGDAAMNFMEFCGTRHRPIYVQDLEETYQSWEKLREHGGQVIYPSHGDPFAAEELARVG
jgi:glyoxylase-like metal-dependent hydrolase (beta-lactamase superfamily II)